MRKSLTKKQILRLKADIDRVFREGRKKKNSCFKVIAVRNGLQYSRFIVIPVRHYGNAVQRNLIRRQVREIMRTDMDSVPSGFDYAVIVFPGYTLEFCEKEKILISLIRKVSVRTAAETDNGENNESDA